MAKSTAHGAGGGRRQSSGMGPAAAARSWHHASRTGAGFTRCCPMVTFAPLHPPEPCHMQAHDLRLVPRSLWEVQMAIPALSIQFHSSSRHHSLYKKCSHFSRLLLLAKPSFKTFSSWVPWQIRACARRCASRSVTPRKRCCGMAQHCPNAAFLQLLPCRQISLHALCLQYQDHLFLFS